MTSVLKYRSISPTLTSIYDRRVAVSLEPPSPTTSEHRFARCSMSYHTPSPTPSYYEPYNKKAGPSLLDGPTTSSRNSGSEPTQRAEQANRPRSFLHQPTPSTYQNTRPISLSSPPPTHRTSSHSGPRVTIPPHGILQHVPSPIGTPVSPLYQSYRFKPIIEDEAEDPPSGAEKVLRAMATDSSFKFPSVTPSLVAPTPRTKRTRPHPRLSILLTPPLSAVGSQGASSPPPTPILAVLEEGYHHCLRTVLKQDALVAAVNHTRHLRIVSSRLYCPESEPRSQGAYGDVWIGRLDETSGSARVVAVKRIRLRHQDGPPNANLLKALLQEVIPWYGLNHRNITPFIGYTFENGHAALISEWQDHGHIFEYLSKHPRAGRREMIAQAAEGLAYLHDRNPSLVHGDIKPENVLVSKEGVVKLTDFGLSTILHSQTSSYLRTTHSFRGTVHYADPTLLDDQPTTKFTDIWAFAWLIFGILTLQRPYNGVQPESRVILKIMSYDVPRPSKYPDLPHGDLIWPVLQACWSRSVKDRWSAGHIARYIRRKT